MKKIRISRANKEIITIFFLLVFVIFFINILTKPNFIMLGLLFLPKAAAKCVAALLIVCALAFVYATTFNRKSRKSNLYLAIFISLLLANTMISLLFGVANRGEFSGYLNSAGLSFQAYFTTNILFILFGGFFLIWVCMANKIKTA